MFARSVGIIGTGVWTRVNCAGLNTRFLWGERPPDLILDRIASAVLREVPPAPDALISDFRIYVEKRSMIGNRLPLKIRQRVKVDCSYQRISGKERLSGWKDVLTWRYWSILPEEPDSVTETLLNLQGRKIRQVSNRNPNNGFFVQLNIQNTLGSNLEHRPLICFVLLIGRGDQKVRQHGDCDRGESGHKTVVAVYHTDTSARRTETKTKRQGYQLAQHDQRQNDYSEYDHCAFGSLLIVVGQMCIRYGFRRIGLLPSVRVGSIDRQIRMHKIAQVD
jgi:hypothetical protein